MLGKFDKSDGVSLRTIQTLLVIGAVIAAALMLYSTYHLTVSFQNLTKASEQQIELRKAARELMDASDYLTESVQRFTAQGDMQFLDNYFEEAFKANRREEAIKKMSEGEGTSDALVKLQSAMDSSVELMNQEYYAMRLVIEAKKYSEYPEILDNVVLSDADKMLAADAKMRRATELVLSDDYYAKKEEIRANMRASLDELEKMAYSMDESALRALSGEMTIVRVIIAIQTILIIFMVWLTTRLGIHPILSAVDRIKSDSPIPEVGANEFRYLARAYNRMYEVYRSSLERLNFKASHDELTGAYNRAGYDLLLSSIDLNSTYMILVDVDDFKNVNDTLGHEVGDKVLAKLVRILKNNFRSDDYVCRIGGDEFVIFMVHTTKMQQDLIVSKVEAINRELENTDDGLPAISVSIGIVHGTEATDAESLFEKTDAAMYRAKRSGKRTYRFHEE